MARVSFLPCVIILAASVLIRGEEPASKPDEALRQELLKRVKEDQAARTEMIELTRHQKPGSPIDPKSPVLARLTQIDEANTRWLKEIVAKHGWPGKSLVGNDGAQAAWLLVQHADRDREFQKKCLGLMKELLPKSKVDKRNFAYLTDRVLVGQGKKQLYGTQFRTVDGKLQPQPIEDEEKVDDRRKEMGLGTMAEYRKQMERTYGPGKK